MNHLILRHSIEINQNGIEFLYLGYWILKITIDNFDKLVVN